MIAILSDGRIGGLHFQHSSFVHFSLKWSYHVRSVENPSRRIPRRKDKSQVHLAQRTAITKDKYLEKCWFSVIEVIQQRERKKPNKLIRLVHFRNSSIRDGCGNLASRALFTQLKSEKQWIRHQCGSVALGCQVASSKAHILLTTNERNGTKRNERTNTIKYTKCINLFGLF